MSVFARLTFALTLAALCAGCFQPLYGEHTVGGGPGLRDKLSSVAVKQIVAQPGSAEARMAVAVRNELLFDLTGGSGTTSPTHELTLRLHADHTSVVLDLTSQRANVENFALEVRYQLKDLATGKTVLDGTTFSRVSYDTPGSEQRFARIRGLRDAENRAAKEVAESLRNRLASYFLAGA